MDRLRGAGSFGQLVWPLAFLGVAVVLVVGQAWLLQNLGLLAFLATPGWLLWVWSQARAHSEWLYRHTSGTWAWLWNRDVQWDTRISFYGLSNTTAPDELRSWLFQQYKDTGVTMIPSDAQHVIVQVFWGTIVMTRTSRRELETGFPDPDRTGSALVIDVQNVGSGYRRAVSLAHTHLGPFLKEATRAAGANHSTYVLRAAIRAGTRTGVFMCD